MNANGMYNDAALRVVHRPFIGEQHPDGVALLLILGDADDEPHIPVADGLPVFGLDHLVQLHRNDVDRRNTLLADRIVSYYRQMNAGKSKISA